MRGSDNVSRGISYRTGPTLRHHQPRFLELRNEANRQAAPHSSIPYSCNILLLYEETTSMSADLLAEFGQETGPPQSSAGRPQAQRQANFSIDDPAHIDGLLSIEQSGNLQHRYPDRNARVSFSQHTGAVLPKKPTFQAFNLPQMHDSDVLFDAATDAPPSDTEDDWGEFEGPEPSVPLSKSQISTSRQATDTAINELWPHQNQKISGTIDLLDSLSMDAPAPPSKKPHREALKSDRQPQPSNPTPEPTWDDDSFGDWGEFANETPSNPPPVESPSQEKQQPFKPAPSQSTWKDDEDWGDFDDGPSTNPALAKPNQTSRPSITSASSNILPGTSSSSSAMVRPTNIPPPSVLLELLVDIFNNLQQEAAKAKARDTSQNIKNNTASNIHNTLETAARIIAGRTLRWKRDTILSQSMRIGPARAGESSGMKLSAVNKHEDVKEKQDAVDVLSLWRERAALFNSVVQAAGRRPVPAVADPNVLKVIMARAEAGAIKASHACALCALKRDERVLKLDADNVQDSFGEWWTEHWGHTACRGFWEANRGLLGQR